MTTIADVALHAGVSVSTVSNVLNGRTDRMRPDTLARIEASIAALDYRPNRAARQLKTGRTSMLGLLVPSIANPMYGYIAREIETVAQERHGHRVVLGNTYRNRDKETGFFEDLLAHGVRGVIVISSLVDEQHVGRLLAGRIAGGRARPTGIVAVNDMLAFGLLAGFREAGLRVPDDVSVIGMDGLFLSALTSPGLSTIRLPVPAMALTIVDRVLGRLADPGLVPDEFLFMPELIARDSVAAPPAAARRRTP